MGMSDINKDSIDKVSTSRESQRNLWLYLTRDDESVCLTGSFVTLRQSNARG